MQSLIIKTPHQRGKLGFLVKASNSLRTEKMNVKNERHLDKVSCSRCTAGTENVCHRIFVNSVIRQLFMCIHWEQKELEGIETDGFLPLLFGNIPLSPFVNW